MWIGQIAYLGTQEVLIIGGIILLVFGGAKIPQLARGMGEGIRELKRSLVGAERGIGADTTAAALLAARPMATAESDDTTRPTT
jgi:TatA/E family protein of Tat protein translocase